MSMEVLYNGTWYTSASDFCNKEKLRPYSAVLKALNEGWSPEDIVNSYGPNANRQEHLISFQGKLYKSLAQASTDIGSDPALAYSLKKKYNFTPAETLQYLVEHRNPNRGKGKTIPICVDGVCYNSQTDAARAYHLSRATITSRMVRDNLSFADALLVADRYRKNLPNMSSVLIDAAVSPLRKDGLGEMNKLQQGVYAYLKETYFSVSLYQEASGQIIFAFPYETRKNKTFTCQLTIGSAGNELYVPLLVENAEETLEMYQTINQFNREQIGCKFWMQRNHISASWSMFVPASAYSSLKEIKQTTAAFLDSCSRLVDQLP